MQEANRAIGAVLRRFRMRSGLTQAHMARATRMSQPMVSGMESGKRTIRFSDALLFALAAGSSPENLLHETREELIARGWLLPNGDPVNPHYESSRTKGL